MHGKPVRLSILSRMDKETIRQEVRGEYGERDETKWIRYEEPQLGKTVTTLVIHGQSIRMVRHGDVQSAQRFIPGKKETGFYRTVYGSMPLAAHTRTVSLKWGNGWGLLDWDYALYIGEEYAGQIAIHIEIREENEV